MKVYTLQLTPSEIDALNWVGGRYEWPGMLECCLDGDKVEFVEHEMWAWTDAVRLDMDGGHNPFPCASPEFAAKLQAFYDEVV